MTLNAWVGMGSGTFESVQTHARATGKRTVTRCVLKGASNLSFLGIPLNERLPIYRFQKNWV